MANGSAAVDFRITCAWCKAVLHEGHPTAPDQISHGCCCACKAKYFPLIGEGSSQECEFELLEREHEVEDRPVSMNPFTDHISYEETSYHIDHEKCTHCGMEQTLDPVPCDCEPDEEEYEPEDRDEIRFDESEVDRG